MSDKKSLLEKILQVQQDLKAPKNQYNSFGKYKYRSCEDILQAARPLCNANGLILTMRDSVEMVGARYYIKAETIVTDVDSGESYSTNAIAREEENKKGMDSSQITGASSSYARKYSLCALFAIDDTKDADTDEYTKQNAAGDAKTSRPNNYPSGVEKGSESCVLKAQALKKVKDAQKNENISNAQVNGIINWKYGKENWNAITLTEACDLADNIGIYIREIEAA